MAVAREKTLAHRLEFVGYAAYEGLFRRMSVEKAAQRGAEWLRAIGPRLPHHRIIRRNLSFAFPELSDEEREAIALDSWSSLGAFAGEFPHMEKFRSDGKEARIRVVDAHLIDEAFALGRGVVFISGHFANFEAMACVLVQRGHRVHVTYRPANNPFVDDRIAARRRAYGTSELAAKGTIGGMNLLRALKRGEGVAIMNDQKNNEGQSVPFFGRPAPTSDGPTRLARRFGCPLVPLGLRRVDHGQYEAQVYAPIEVDQGEDEEKAIFNTIGRINTFIEARVRERPAEWFWVHRRWPKADYR